MHEIQTDIVIHATPENVWAVLSDFAAFPEWNPFIPRITGTLKLGGCLKIRMTPPGSFPATFYTKVQILDANHELRWLGRPLVPGIFDGQHRFVIHPLPDGTVRFEQAERFSGILVGFFTHRHETITKPGFALMNAALKARVEALYPVQPTSR